MIEDRGSSFKVWVENFSWKRTLYKCTLTFLSKNYRSVHWVRLVCFHVNEAHALKAKMCDLSHENIPYEWMHGKRMHSKHADENQITKPFKMEWPNGWTDKENFCTDEVKRMHGWGRTDKLLKKVFLNGWTAEENNYFWTDAVDRPDDRRKFFIIIFKTSVVNFTRSQSTGRFLS